MKSLVSKILIGAAGLVLAAAPLAASAQDWHGQNNNDRGGYRSNDNRGYDNRRNDDRGYRDRNDRRDNRDQSYRGRGYTNGYYGRAPGGYQGYYSNGNWYQHRRWNGGIWIYF
jgi:hypothetical protein